MVDKQNKVDVNYSEGVLHSHCGPVFHDDKFYCRHFVPATARVGRCDLVAGAIIPEMWCELYKRTGKSK